MIDENDSGEDCVYIHTKKPNADNFPIKVLADNINEIKDKDLKQFVDYWTLKEFELKQVTEIFTTYLTRGLELAWCKSASTQHCI